VQAAAWMWRGASLLMAACGWCRRGPRCRVYWRRSTASLGAPSTLMARLLASTLMVRMLGLKEQAALVYC
jgi:hypothetical protein